MPLNINLQQILLHALNFVILFGAMYFLLYKPVKDYMESRKAHYVKMDEDAKAALAEAEQTKAQYAEQLKAADEEIARVRAQADEALRKEADEQRAQAQQQADDILKKARTAAASEHERVMERRDLRADERRRGKAGAQEHLGRVRSVSGHGGGAQGQWLSAPTV